MDFLFDNRNSIKFPCTLLWTIFVFFSFILDFVFVDFVSEGPKLEHCQFWLPFRSVIEEFEPVVHFLTTSWFLNGECVPWYLWARCGIVIFLFWVIFTISYNLGHNILRLFDVLPNFIFTTSETNHHY